MSLPNNTAVPALPFDIWVRIMKIEAERQRLEWWNNLSWVEQNYMEWPMSDGEFAIELAEDILQH